MHGAMRDSYVPDHDYAYQRRPDTPRSSSTLTNTPFRTATSSSSPYTTRRRSTQHTPPDNTATTIDTSLPKNFPKPLTCFFWQQNGRCSKRDIDCVYAHWDTGYMSSAPVTPLGSTESLAGKKLFNYTTTNNPDAPSLSLQEIRKREFTVIHRETKQEEKERALKRLQNLLEEKQSGVLRREREVEERERVMVKKEAHLARKRKGVRFLEKRGMKREEALGTR